MYHSTKSDIIHCIEREAEAVSHGATETDTQQQHDCVVQDGGQLVHQLDSRGTGTFEQFTQRLFLKHLQVELRKVSRLDIVWDIYRPMSIKGHTRDECVRLKVGPNVRIPGKWSEFLRDSTNKVEPFKYLSGDAAVPLRRRYLHHYEQRNDWWSCRSWRGYDNCVQPGGSRHTDHPSHHPCSELPILQHSDQDI